MISIGVPAPATALHANIIRSKTNHRAAQRVRREADLGLLCSFCIFHTLSINCMQFSVYCMVLPGRAACVDGDRKTGR
jgi:hypothetical protein